LYESAKNIVSKNNELVAISPSENPIREGKFVDLGCELVISFLNSYIFKKNALLLPNINFHPSPPSYPGIAGASRALYDGVNSFGVTAHRIAHQVDAGEILQVKLFPIEPNDNSESLRQKAEDASFELLEEVMHYVNIHGRLPIATGENWSGNMMTKKEFKKWMVLDPNDFDDFERKIRALRNHKFEGPFIDIHGYKFGLINN
jgi:methionyl-tRNA formyltransferase